MPGTPPPVMPIVRFVLGQSMSVRIRSSKGPRGPRWKPEVYAKHRWALSRPSPTEQPAETRSAWS
eukprot:5360632-Lingulodinium_polyedra.AAC.1